MPSPSRLPAFEVREQSRSRGSDGSALASERQAEGVACRQAHHLAGARDFAVGSPRCSIDGKGGDDMTPTGTERTTVEADVLRADDQRFDAMRRGDWTALDAALADDLTYVHSTARLESKAEHIANLRAGKPHYRGIAPRERSARVHGGIGIVNGVSEMHVENAGKEQRFTVRYLAVYAKAGEHWRMIAWQSTRQPDA